MSEHADRLRAARLDEAPLNPETPPAHSADSLATDCMEGVVDPLVTSAGELSSLAQREQRYALAMLGANDGLWDWNIDTDEVYISPRAGEILNIRPEELARTSWALLSYIHPDDLPEFRRKIVDHIKGKSPSFEVEYRIEDQDGRTHWVLHRGLALRDENGWARRMAGSLSDITRRKQGELVLMEAKNQAESAARAKSDFLAHMSHELRTPLNAIIGFADMMREQVFGPMPDDHYTEYVQNIVKSGEHLLSLINDVLDTAKIEAGKFELDDGVVNLLVLIREVTGLIRPRAERQGIVLRDDLPPFLPNIRGDERRLRQVLLNLLSNAVKFSLPGGLITVEVIVDGPNGLIIRLRDRGVGMNPEDIPRVLETFGQVNNQIARSQEGTGLGLPLSRALIELHGGRLRLDSALGEGTTVTVFLPPDRVIIA